MPSSSPPQTLLSRGQRGNGVTDGVARRDICLAGWDIESIPAVGRSGQAASVLPGGTAWWLGHPQGMKQSPQSMRPHGLPARLIQRSLLMDHEPPVCALVSLLERLYFAIDPHAEMLYFGRVAMTARVCQTRGNNVR